jgi:hypothetical protein
MESVYQAFLVSVLRSMLLVAGGWLVSRGLVDDGLMREVAAGLALIVVSQVWAFVRIHRRVLYQRALLLLGIEAAPGTDPALVETDARAWARRG